MATPVSKAIHFTTGTTADTWDVECGLVTAQSLAGVDSELDDDSTSIYNQLRCACVDVLHESTSIPKIDRE